MKQIVITIQRITPVLLLLLVSCVPTTPNESDSQVLQGTGNAGDSNTSVAMTNNTPSPTITMQSAYPVPASTTVTQSGYPYPIPTTAMESAYIAPPTPSPTWWPTPWPSPVRIEQSTPTAIPARQPSNEASGTLYYATVGGEAHPPTLFAASVVDGKVTEGNEDQLVLELRDSARFVRLYPSPTNDMLAIIESDWGDFITILDLKQHEITPVYNNWTNQMPSFWDFYGWHPNGRQFLISDSRGSFGLWLIDGLGLENPVKLTEYDTDSASMSPTSQMLAYAYQPDLSLKSLLMLAWSDGSHPQTLYETSSRTPYEELSWSSDGTLLAYTRGGYEMWVYVDGERVKLFDGYKADTGYSWSPDSRFIAYVGRTGASEEIPAKFEYVFDKGELRIFDMETSTIYIPDPQDTVGASAPSWSPDGRFAIFTAIQDGRLEVMKVAVDDLESMQVEKMLDSEYMISSAVWIAPVGE